MEHSGAEIITTLLERQGVETIAGIPGGAILPLYDALRRSHISHVLARHEQGAGFIAQGMARATGSAGVCLACSGPGATNLVTAIADAMSDSIPLVAITGQVPTSLIGTNAFQEVDTIRITGSITKRNFFVRSPGELLDVLPEAFAVAESGRAGPVLIDVPKDVQAARTFVEKWPEPGKSVRTSTPLDSAALLRVAELIDAAARPILYIGGGVIASGASELVRALARRADLFVTSTLHGLGAFPSDDALFLGMLGMHAAPFTNLALEETDLLIAVGARFDDRATGKPSEFCRRATIVHLDIDRREIGKNKPAHAAVVGDAAEILSALLSLVKPAIRQGWRTRVRELRERFPLPEGSNAPLAPLALIRALAAAAPSRTLVTTDVGQHQMWVAQAYPFAEPRTLLTSGGLGTMGFGLPAAIGAALAVPDARVVCVSGDGSLLMNVQELATLAELDLPVAVVVLDNGSLGLVRQQQELFYGERYNASRYPSALDFVAIGRAFGIKSVRLDPNRAPGPALEDALSGRRPVLIHVPIPHDENVLPMVPPGAANRDMIGATRDRPSRDASSIETWPRARDGGIPRESTPFQGPVTLQREQKEHRHEIPQ